MEPHAARVVTLTFMEPEAARDADVRIKRDQSEGRQRAAGAPAALPDHGSGGGGADLSRKLVTAAVSGDDPSGELSLIKEEVQVRVKGYVSVECEVQMRPVRSRCSQSHERVLTVLTALPGGSVGGGLREPTQRGGTGRGGTGRGGHYTYDH